MGRLRRGDVVLVRFPFSSGSGQKRRPAVVVQGDALNARLTNTIIAQVTGNTGRLGPATQVLVDPATPEGGQSGLLLPSVVNCTVLFTIEQTLIARKLGTLHATTMALVDRGLASALDLP